MLQMKDYEIGNGKKIVLLDKESYDRNGYDYVKLTSVQNSHLCLLSLKEFEELSGKSISCNGNFVNKVALNLKFREIFKKNLMYLMANSRRFSLYTDRNILTEDQLSYLNEKVGLVKISDEKCDYLVFGDTRETVIDRLSPEIFLQVIKLYYLFAIESNEIRKISEKIYLRCVVEGE